MGTSPINYHGAKLSDTHHVIITSTVLQGRLVWVFLFFCCSGILIWKKWEAVVSWRWHYDLIDWMKVAMVWLQNLFSDVFVITTENPSSARYHTVITGILHFPSHLHIVPYGNCCNHWPLVAMSVSSNYPLLFIKPFFFSASGLSCTPNLIGSFTTVDFFLEELTGLSFEIC